MGYPDMNLSVADIIRVTEAMAPPELAEAWDNIGLQVGSRDWPVKRIWVALDPLPQVVADACQADVDLLITHHPLIFKPLKSIDCTTPVGAIIGNALQHRLTIFSAHTNLDSAADGVNDALAHRIGLRNLSVLRPAADESRPVDEGDDMSGREPLIIQGLGRTGDLPHEQTLASLARDMKNNLKLESVAIAGDPDLAVGTVALCSGSGASLLGDFFASGAQAYISGDLRYHDAREVEIAGRGLIDIGHFASEHLIVDILADRLAGELAKTAGVVTVEAYRLEKDPFITI